jgi:putative ABC transport system substrate-binding protein
LEYREEIGDEHSSRDTELDCIPDEGELDRLPPERAMNKRRQLIVALGAGALACPTRILAQSPGNIPRVGLLWIDAGGASPYVAALREGLRARGYVDGKNIRIDDRTLVDRYELIPDAAERLVSDKVDVIVCYGATAIQAASKSTSTIPIVMVLSGDPVKLGVVASLSRPGGNVTGTSSISQELSGKRLELLKQVVPGLRRVAVLLYPESVAEVRSLRNYEAAGRALNLEILPVDVRAPADIGPAIAGISRLGVQAIALVGSTLLTANSKQVVDAVAAIHLPAIYANVKFALSGGLMAYAADITEGFHYAATYVDKILKGAKPGELAIEQPTKVELVINTTAANALGLTIPQSLLLRADKLIS